MIRVFKRATREAGRNRVATGNAAGVVACARSICTRPRAPGIDVRTNRRIGEHTGRFRPPDAPSTALRNAKLIFAGRDQTSIAAPLAAIKQASRRRWPVSGLAGGMSPETAPSHAFDAQWLESRSFTRLPLRGQYRTCTEQVRTGFPFHPRGANPSDTKSEGIVGETSRAVNGRFGLAFVWGG
jgi:hypothetical protein